MELQIADGVRGRPAGQLVPSTLASVLVVENSAPRQLYLHALLNSCGLTNVSFVADEAGAKTTMSKSRYDLVLRAHEQGYALAWAQNAENISVTTGRHELLPLLRKGIDFSDREERPIVNLAALQTITGDDTVLEKELLGIFLSETRSNLKTMKQCIGDANSGLWPDIAHKMKGGASNIGAEDLRILCAVAQHMPDGDAKAREKLFSDLKEIFTDVETYLIRYLGAE